jgi:hypothetical protein
VAVEDPDGDPGDAGGIEKSEPITYSQNSARSAFDKIMLVCVEALQLDSESSLFALPSPIG